MRSSALPWRSGCTVTPCTSTWFTFGRQELEAFQHECVTDWERIRYFERI